MAFEPFDFAIPGSFRNQADLADKVAFTDEERMADEADANSFESRRELERELARRDLSPKARGILERYAADTSGGIMRASYTPESPASELGLPATFEPFATAELPSTFEAFVPPAQENPRGAFAEIGVAGLRGFLSKLPEMVGNAFQFAGEAPSEELGARGSALYEVGTSLRNVGEDYGEKPWLKAKPEGHGLINQTIVQGAEMIGPSVSAMGLMAIPGMQGIGGLTAASALGASIFGASQAQDTFERGKDAGLSDSEANATAWKVGRIEAGGEFIGTMALGWLFGMVGKVAGKTLGSPVNAVFSAYKNPAMLKEFAKRLPATYGTEIFTEMGQNAGERAIEEAAGIPGVTPWEAAKEAIGPTAAMTTLLAPFGIAGHARQAKAQTFIADTVSKAENDPKYRNLAADQIATSLKEVDPEFAAKWSAYAKERIAKNQPVDLSVSFGKPEAKVPDILSAGSVDEAIAKATEATSAPLFESDIAGTVAGELIPSRSEPVPSRGLIARNMEQQLAGVSLDAAEAQKAGDWDRAEAQIAERVANLDRMQGMLRQREEAKIREDVAALEADRARNAIADQIQTVPETAVGAALARAAGVEPVQAETPQLNREQRRAALQPGREDILARLEAVQETPNAQENVAGLPSQVVQGQEPVQAQSEQGAGQEAVETGGILQAQRSDQQPGTVIPTTPDELTAATYDHLVTAFRLSRSDEIRGNIAGEILKRDALNGQGNGADVGIQRPTVGNNQRGNVAGNPPETVRLSAGFSDGGNRRVRSQDRERGPSPGGTASSGEMPQREPGNVTESQQAPKPSGMGEAGVAPGQAATLPETAQTASGAAQPAAPAESTAATPVAKPAPVAPAVPMLLGKPITEASTRVLKAARNGKQAEAVKAEEARRAAAPTGNPVETFAGRYSEGMNEVPARQQQAELAKKRPELTWRVEASKDMKYPFIVAGYQAAQEARGAVKAPAAAQPTATPETVASAPTPAVEQAAQKEQGAPWQMTRREYEAKGVQLPEGHPLLKEAASARRDLESAKKSLLSAAKIKEDRYGAVADALKRPFVSKSVKNAYQDANGIVKNIEKQVNAITDHKAVVEQAIAEGKPVPANVLAEYPDLAKAAPAEVAQHTEGGKTEEVKSATVPMNQQREDITDRHLSEIDIAYGDEAKAMRRTKPAEKMSATENNVLGKFADETPLQFVSKPLLYSKELKGLARNERAALFKLLRRGDMRIERDSSNGHDILVKSDQHRLAAVTALSEKPTEVAKPLAEMTPADHLEAAAKLMREAAAPKEAAKAAEPEALATFKKAAQFDAWLKENGVTDEQLNPTKGDSGVAQLVLDPGKTGYREQVSGYRQVTEGADTRLVYRLGDGRLVWWNHETGEVRTIDPQDKRLDWYEKPAPQPAPEQAKAGEGPMFALGPSTEGIKVDVNDLSKAVLARMDMRLKSMGYDSRGSDDVRTILNTRIAKDGVITHPDWIAAYETAVGGAQASRERMDTKRAARGASANVDFARMRELGLTEDWREAGYITPAGSLIDLSGKREGGERGTRAYDHREAGGTAGMQEYMALGNIRTDFNSGSLDIAKEPTAQQYRQIADFADMKGGEVVVDLEDGLGEVSGDHYRKADRSFAREYPIDTKPSRIVADIRKFFAGEEPVALPTRFARATAPDHSIPAPFVQRIVDRMRSRWANAPQIEVIATMDQAPARVRDYETLKRSQGAKGVIRGFIEQGVVYIVAGNNASVKEVIETIMHESAGHWGLRGLLKERLDPILDDVAKSMPDQMQAKAEHYKFDLSDQRQVRQAAEEILAELASKNPNASLVRRLVAVIRQFLRDIGIQIKFSHNDLITNFVIPARRFVELGGKAQGGMSLVPQFMATAYHGTPHVWPPEPGFPHGRPRLDKIGTGEGAQSYGWGWYSAENEQVGGSYQLPGTPGAAKQHAIRQIAKYEKLLSGNNLKWPEGKVPADGGGFIRRSTAEQVLSEAKQRLADYVTRGGSLYRLDIPDDVLPKLLDWDRPLSEQTKEVKLLLQREVEGRIPGIEKIYRDRGIPESRIAKIVAATKQNAVSAETTGGDYYRGLEAENAKAASEYLASIGIPGNKYLDQGSRTRIEPENKYFAQREDALQWAGEYGDVVDDGSKTPWYEGKAGVDSAKSPKGWRAYRRGTPSYNFVIWDQKVLDRVALLERNGEKLDAMQGTQLFSRGALEQERLASKGADQTQTPEFKRWFGASKVVDAEGRPLVVYHGTASSFSEFYRGTEGHFFTDSPVMASNYAGTMGREASGFAPELTPNVMPVYLSLKNPAPESKLYPGVTRGSLEAQGYDGIIYKNKIEGAAIYVAFHPQQIKSATGNTGAFSPTNPDIRFSQVATGETGMGAFTNDPSPEEASKVQLGIEGKSVREAAIFVAKTAPNRSYRSIAYRVAAQLRRLEAAGMKFTMNVAHLSEEAHGQLAGKMRGVTWRAYGSDTIDIWLQGADVTGLVGTSYETVLHELLHAVTQSAIYVGSQPGNTALHADVTDLYRVNIAIVQHVQSKIAKAGGDVNKLDSFIEKIFAQDHNSLREPGEMVSWALTNRRMQEYLESIPYKGGTLWSRFVSAIRKFLGLPDRAETALSEILRITDRLLDSPVQQMLSISPPMQINYTGGLLNTSRSEAPEGMVERLQQAIPQLARNRISEIADNLIYNYQNRFMDLPRIQRQLHEGVLPENMNANLAVEAYPKVVSAKIKDFHDDYVKSFVKLLHDSKLSIEQAQEYVNAKDAPDRNREMKARNPTAPELDAMKADLAAERDTLAGEQAVQDFIAKRRELRQTEADVEDGIADQSAVEVLQGEIAALRKDQAVKDYSAAIDKLKALQPIKPFEGDNTALSGMSDAQAKAILAKARKDGTFEALERVSASVDTITARTRQILLENGLAKPDEIAAWEELYPHYVPRFRDEVDGTAHPIGQGFQVRGKESKRATGSTKEVTNILAHVMAAHEAAIIRAEKVKADRALYAFLAAHPGNEVAELDIAPKIRDVDTKTGLVIERVDPLYKNKPNVLVLKIDGDEHTITFNEDNPEALRLAASMKNLSAQDIGEITAMVGKFTRFLATMNTAANPVFTLRNFMRDVGTAFVNLSDTELAGMKKQVFADIPKSIKGFWDMTRGNMTSEMAQRAREFRDAGGQTGFVQHYKDIVQRAETLEQQLTTLGPGKWNFTKRAAAQYWSMIEDANLAVENGVRLSAYVNARKAGLSQAKAISLSNNLTVNFTQRGARGAELNMWYMFMNASIQGTARLIKAMGNRNVQKIVGGVVASAFLLDILNRALAGDDDDDGENDYDQLPDYVKANNFVFYLGRPITVPMPYGYNFFASVGRMMSEAIFRQNYNPAKSAVNLGNIFLDAFSPMGNSGSLLQFAAPTIADPFIQWAENRNFAGNPLRREQLPFGPPKPEYQMGFKSTSAPAKAIAEVLNDMTGGNEVRPGLINMNPGAFDFAVTSLLGGAGRTYLQVFSLPIKVALGEDIQAREVPVANIFASAKPEYQIERTFVEHLRAMQITAEEVKHYRGDAEALANIRENHAVELRLVQRAKNVSSVLARLRKQERLIEKNKPEGWRDRQKQIEERKRKMMTQFNKSYVEAMQ